MSRLDPDTAERWPTIQPFRIADKTWDHFEFVVVELERNGIIGRGEALGVCYLAETPEKPIVQISQKSAWFKNDISRAGLQFFAASGWAG